MAGQSEAAPRRVKAAVGSRLKRVLFVLFGLFALMGVNSAYLTGVTFVEWVSGQVYQDWFYLIMFLLHLILGLLLVIPFLVFGAGHFVNSFRRRNRRAVWVGCALFVTGLALIVSGLLLTRVEIGGIILGVLRPGLRNSVYWIHVLSPLVAVWLFVLHRLAGRKIRWKIGLSWAGAAAVFALAMLGLQTQDPRKWDIVGNPRGEQYFFPSLARTVSGQFISAQILDNDAYCKDCHADVHEKWSHSVHRFASFNNPAYLAAVRETRRVVFERDGSVQASRFCAGCHDPVPFYSGAFDEPRFDSPEFDLSQDRMANAGITCSVCHSISHVNSPRGNADYTIDEPIHYPFATSSSPTLKWVNQQLVKAKPAFHKKTFFKPLHKTAEFCGTCHKVHLPEELNHYKWLRGQNHFDPFWISGVSGYGVASFYYPARAEPNCNECHMKPFESDDFGAKALDDSGLLKVHNHQFPSANTAIPALLGMPDWVNQAHVDFNQEVMRVDLFGLREGGEIDGNLHAPLRPVLPNLEKGRTYLLETVIRTLKMGHLFPQGTADSNEPWLEVRLFSDGREIGRSGGLDEAGDVDSWSHFVTAYVLDKNGNRITRRNAQDIFVALYDNQIPPGAADVVHYQFRVPPDAGQFLTIEARLLYRKFDTRFTRFFQGEKFERNDLPVMVLAQDRVTLTVGQTGEAVEAGEFPGWQRWNDYGIGLLRRRQYRQAEAAFSRVEELGRPDGPLNLARIYLEDGRVQQDAPAALARAKAFDDPKAAPWTVLWLSGLVNQENGRYEDALANFRELEQGGFPEAAGRNFDFSKDYRLLNQLGRSLYQCARQERGQNRREARDLLLNQAASWYGKALVYDPENLEAHWGLKQVYNMLGDSEKERYHEEQHAKYKPDDNARDRAIAIARQNDPAANQAAERVVIYDLQRPGRPVNDPVTLPTGDSR